MKRYDRPLTHDEGLAKVKEQGLVIDAKKYNAGADHITIVFPVIGPVLWSSWNGKFLGTLADGRQYSSDSTRYDDEPWKQTLLDFFYHPLADA